MLLDAVWPKKATMVNYATDQKILGVVCSQSHEGNSMVILWLELLFFLTNIFIILGSLFGAWFDETNVKEPKTSDKILVKDFRNCGANRKSPGLHIFSLQGFEQLHWGKRIELPGVDAKYIESWKVGDLKPVKLIENENKIAHEIEEDNSEEEAEKIYDEMNGDGQEEYDGGDDIQTYGEEGAEEEQAEGDADDEYKKCPVNDEAAEVAPVVDPSKNSQK